VVKGDLGNCAVAVDIPLQIGICNVLQGVLIGFLFQQVGLRGNFKQKHAPFFNLYYCIQLYILLFNCQLKRYTKEAHERQILSCASYILKVIPFSGFYFVWDFPHSSKFKEFDTFPQRIALHFGEGSSSIYTITFWFSELK